jgi:diguanylate cyclase (GGDEF)-like protein
MRVGQGSDWFGRAFQHVGTWLVTASIVLALGLWTSGAVLLWMMRSNVLSKALLASDNLLATMSSDIARNLDMFDLSLQAVIDNSKHPGIGSVSKDIRQLVLFDRAATAKYLRSIQVLDKDGWLSLDSRTLSPPRKNHSSRDYFLVHQSNPGIGFYLGTPFFGDRGGYRIGISRRLSNRDGSFAGVVVGVMELNYFKDMFSRVEISPGSLLAMTNVDGTLLMRRPLGAGDIGKDMSQSALFTRAIDSQSGHFEANGVRDGTPRIYAFRRVGNYPLLITMGLSIADALASWRDDAVAICAILLVLGISMIALAMFASGELRRREDAEARLRILATTDALTQIPNRRGFAVSMAREWNEALTTRSSVALLMIDVDHFKAFNDRHGHQAGDRALILIGRILDDARRNERDFVARYGGEEFAMILPGTPASEAAVLAERIRARVAERESQDTEASPPTVSIGVVSKVPNMPDASDILVALADAALYRAKAAGRNCTVAHDGGTSPSFAPLAA